MFSTQSVANILWAAGNTPELVPLDVNVLDALAKMTYSKFGEFTTQGLANTLWGFAGSGYNPGEGLFAEIRRYVLAFPKSRHCFTSNAGDCSDRWPVTVVHTWFNTHTDYPSLLSTHSSTHVQHTPNTRR
jgi:hypothetical protein